MKNKAIVMQPTRIPQRHLLESRRSTEQELDEWIMQELCIFITISQHDDVNLLQLVQNLTDFLKA